jgi:hypothetical protein
VDPVIPPILNSAVPVPTSPSASSLQPISSSVHRVGTPPPASDHLPRSHDPPILPIPSSDNVPSDVTVIQPTAQTPSSQLNPPTRDNSPVGQDNLVPTGEYIYCPPAWPEGYETTDLLERYSLVHNKISNVIICRPCGRGMCLPTMKSHMKSFHPDDFKLLKADYETITDMYLEVVNNPTSPIKPSLLPSRPVPFLKVVPGFTCTALGDNKPCFRTLAAERSIREHIKKDHHGNGYEPRSCGMQTYFLERPAVSYFPIVEVTEESTPVHYLSTALRVTDQLMTRHVPDDHGVPTSVREVHPFYRNNHWHEHLERYDKRVLRDLVSGTPLKESHLEAKLAGFIDTYFETVNEKLRSNTIHDSVLKLLSVKDG